MLNFCYIYGTIWTIVIVLYSLHWSDLCYPLQTTLTVFFVMTIIVSFFLGYIFRNYFKFEKILIYPHRKCGLTIAIIIVCLLDYYYCGQIPLVAILTGTYGYTDFKGIPTVHTIIGTFSTFYAQYLFYLSICFPEKRKKLILEYISILTIAFLFQFSRGKILINLFISASMFLAAKSKGIDLKQKIVFFIGILTIFYIFGGLGNLRSGYNWNDSSYIMYLGRCNNNYPSWLPEQFMWAYSYITSPLVNLNYNVFHEHTNSTILGTLISFLPDFITKRLFPDFFFNTPLLEVSYFTAVSAFGVAYLWGGDLGLVFFYIIIIIGQLFVLHFIHIKMQYKMPLLAVMCAMVAFTMFTHTISYSAISFTAIYPLLTIFSIKRIKQK